MRIAITGLAASGKGTIARRIAKDLNLNYVDAGLVFRAFAYSVSLYGIKSLKESVDSNWISYQWVDNSAKIFFKQSDVTRYLHQPHISLQTSTLCEDVCNTKLMLNYTNSVISNYSDVIVDGRNAGIDLLPNPTVCFYLAVQSEIRAMRRFRQLVSSGQSVSFEEVFSDLIARDKRDQMRAFAPFVIPSNAITLPNDENQEQAITYIKEYILCMK